MIINKMQGGLQELDETAYWLELLSESGIVKPDNLRFLEAEAEELTAIFVAVIKKVRRKR